MNLRPVKFLRGSGIIDRHAGSWKAGDWIEFSNYQDYSTRHPGGMWGQEQTIMLGPTPIMAGGVPAITAQLSGKVNYSQIQLGAVVA